MFNSIIPVFGFKMTCAELKHTKYFFMSYRLFCTYVHCILFMCNFQCCMNYIIQLHMSKHTHAKRGKSHTINGFTISRPSQILQTNENGFHENSRSQTSPIIWDGWQQIGKIRSISIFPMCHRFLGWLAIIPDT